MPSMKNLRPRVPKTFTSWRVQGENSRWTNEDIVPVPEEQRIFTSKAFFGYWVAAGVNTTAWALGSSNLANGLTAAEAIGGVLVGGVIAGLVAFVCSEPGVKYHLGFPMMSRAAFGMYGSTFVIMLKIFVNFIFCGVQAYWGGLAAKVVLSSIFPSFQNMANTLPASAQIETNQLVGFIVYILVFTPMMMIHPSKLQPVLWAAFFAVAATMFSMFVWAVAVNHGASVLGPSKAIGTGERAFRILQAISAVAGGWTGSGIRQSDWTRFARTKRAPVLNQLIAAPVTLTVTAMLGVFATSAVKHMYGKALWQPIQLLEFLLDNNYDSKTRAGCFFAGLGFFISQISVNLAQNSVSCGMDLASLAPPWIDVRRGSLIMCFVAYLIQPWRFVNAPGTFITVLSSFGMFVSPLAGINAIDFWIIRKKAWKVPDLYVGNSSSIYWYDFGWNWRAIVAWTLAVWPSFPGFIGATSKTKVALGWTRTFQVSWFVGFLGAALVYWTVCQISPPPGKPYVSELYNPEERFLEGVSDNVSEATEKDVMNSEKGRAAGSVQEV